MNESKPLHQHQALQAIETSVSTLTMPTLSPLIRVFMEKKADINEKRAAINQQMDDLRIEGFGAATRLMLPDEKIGQNTQGTYFERIQQQRGDSNG